MGSSPSRPHRPSLSTLPTELHLLISTHLDLPSTHSLLLTSRYFHRLLLPHLHSFAPLPHGYLTALQWACIHSHPPLVRLLLSQGSSGPLDHHAAGHGQSGKTALMHAVASSSVPLTALLLSHGASPNIQDASGNTAIHAAVSSAPQHSLRALLSFIPGVAPPPPPPVLELLLAARPDLEVKNSAGNTALHEAALRVGPRTGVAALKVLVEAGADVKAANGFKYTPLHFVAERGSVDGARALVEAGADVAAGGEWCLTPGELAGSRGWWRVKGFLEGVRVGGKIV